MFQFILLIHLLGSIAMGIYLLIPFLLQRMAGQAGAAQAGLIGGLYTANRIGQFLLVAQFLTGGYLVGGGGYTIPWMAVSIILLLALGGFTGVMGKAMKQMREKLSAGQSAAAEAGKARMFGWLTFLFILLEVVLMKNPGLF